MGEDFQPSEYVADVVDAGTAVDDGSDGQQQSSDDAGSTDGTDLSAFVPQNDMPGMPGEEYTDGQGQRYIADQGGQWQAAGADDVNPYKPISDSDIQDVMSQLGGGDQGSGQGTDPSQGTGTFLDDLEALGQENASGPGTSFVDDIQQNIEPIN